MFHQEIKNAMLSAGLYNHWRSWLEAISATRDTSGATDWEAFKGAFREKAPDYDSGFTLLHVDIFTQELEERVADPYEAIAQTSEEDVDSRLLAMMLTADQRSRIETSLGLTWQQLLASRLSSLWPEWTESVPEVFSNWIEEHLPSLITLELTVIAEKDHAGDPDVRYGAEQITDDASRVERWWGSFLEEMQKMPWDGRTETWDTFAGTVHQVAAHFHVVEEAACLLRSERSELHAYGLLSTSGNPSPFSGEPTNTLGRPISVEAPQTLLDEPTGEIESAALQTREEQPAPVHPAGDQVIAAPPSAVRDFEMEITEEQIMSEKEQQNDLNESLTEFLRRIVEGIGYMPPREEIEEAFARLAGTS